MHISQFASNGPTAKIYEDAVQAWWASKDYSNEEAVSGYVVWCIEDTIENEELEWLDMYNDYLRRVIACLESYQEFVAHEGDAIPEEIYHGLAEPYLDRLQAFL